MCIRDSNGIVGNLAIRAILRKRLNIKYRLYSCECILHKHIVLDVYKRQVVSKIITGVVIAAAVAALGICSYMSTKVKYNAEGDVYKRQPAPCPAVFIPYQEVPDKISSSLFCLPLYT